MNTPADRPNPTKFYAGMMLAALWASSNTPRAKPRRKARATFGMGATGVGDTSRKQAAPPAGGSWEPQGGQGLAEALRRRIEGGLPGTMLALVLLALAGLFAAAARAQYLTLQP